MSDRDVGIRRSIVTKLLKVVFTFYLLIAIGVTLGHMVLEYGYQKDSISEDLIDIQMAYEKGLAVSMWQMNQESLSSTIQGILKIPVIVGIKIKNLHGDHIAVGGIVARAGEAGNVGQHTDLLGFSQNEYEVQHGEYYKFEVFEHHFPITYSYKDKEQQLGTVSIYSNTSVIFRRVKFGFSLLIFNAILKTLALWCIFLYFSDRLLRKPLAELATSTEGVNLDNLEFYKVKVDTEGKNELKVLEESFNTMIRNLYKSIQEKEQAEQSLQSSEIQYRLLFEKTNDAIFVVQKNTGKYLDANKAAEQLTGRDLTELKQLTTHDVTPDNSDKRLRAVNKLTTQAGLEVVTYVRPDGTSRTARLNIVPLDSDVIIGIARDISDELAMQEKLRQSQKMEAIGTLAGGIAHDFNNILAAIFGYTELAKVNAKDNPSMSTYLDQVMKAGHRAKGLVQQILTFSRHVDKDCILLQPASIVEEVVKMLQPTLPATIKIIQNIEPTTSHIYADPTQVNQILMNLCTNAYHAMEEHGGRLEVSLKEIQLSVEDLRHEPDTGPGLFYKLSVSDSGSGISPEILDKIFDPYFTTKSIGKGTGLGLSIVHGVMKSYGGFVSVSSDLDVGTVVDVFFPIAQGNSLPHDSAAEPIPLGTEHVLFVDDEELLTTVSESMLTKLGYKVTVCNDSREALELFERHPELFDIVITDQTMPVMTGSELARRMIEIRPDIPIILCTGYSSIMSMEKAKVIGIREFALKPMLVKEISVLIRKALQAR